MEIDKEQLEQIAKRYSVEVSYTEKGNGGIKKDIITVELDSRLKEELNESIKQLYDLFMIAYDLNQSENTRTTFSQKTTTYLSGILQTLQYMDGQINV